MSVKQVVGFVIGAGALAATVLTGGLAAPLTTKLLIAAGIRFASAIQEALLRGGPALQKRQAAFFQQRSNPEMPIPLVYGTAKLGALRITPRIGL